jgi:folate-binding protein YgfZ
MSFNSAIAEVSGPDSKTFLQNLLATDLSKISDGSGSFACILNHQGKVKFTFSLFRYKDSWLLSLKEEDLTLLISDLNKYILRSKVIINITTNYKRVLVKDSNDPEVTNKINSLFLSFFPLGNELSDIIFLQSDEELIKDNIKSKDLADWDDLIISGVPYISYSHEIKYTSSILGLQAYGAVSNNKGCYPGQEIVNKLSRTGILKRCLVLFSSTKGLIVNPNQEVFSNSKIVGNIINYGERGYSLGVLLRSCADENCYLSDGAQLKVVRIIN